MARISSFLPTFFSLVSILLVIVLLVAGVNNGLSQVYYLKTVTTNLAAPAKLAESTFLADLSTVSGTDWVGSNATSQSLGLADSYTISLLTLCAHFDSGSTECTAPKVGFTFNPASDLHLDGTSLHGTFSQDLLDALSNYSKVSRFLPLGYVVGVLLLLLGTLSDWFSHRSRAAAIFASLFGLIATILFFAASITAVVIFKQVNDAYNANFNANGLSSTLGIAPIAMGFVAFVFALLSASAFIVHARGSGSSGRRGLRAIGANSKARGIVTGHDPLEAVPLSGAAAAAGVGGAGPKPGLWGRVPTWNRHTYVQVEKQPVLGRNNVESQRAIIVDEHDHDPEESVRRRLDDDWATQDDYSHVPSYGPDSHSNIPMLTLGDSGRSLDHEPAFEPFKDRPS